MIDLSEHVALVTGAGSGIGRAIALSLWSCGARLHLIGRTRSKLEATAQGMDSQRVTIWPTDLTAAGAATMIRTSLEKTEKRVDILVHSAGTILPGPVDAAPGASFDSQFQSNVRAPFALTQALLPLLKRGPGQVVFINSSAGLKAVAGAAQYSATKHALKAVADSVRDEVNRFGIRVLSVYPGRTATPTQAQLYTMRNQKYEPELLLQPEDVASIVVAAVSLPRTAEVTDLSIRPLHKSY